VKEGVGAAQREALLLVGAEAYTYEEAAARLQCQVGTVKSRVSRARTHLAGLLGFDDAQAAVNGT
jgi:RNA polymerase sigma-70 factor, ECF subfamily